MVLYPGTRAPLHLFEPRYRQLLADVQQGDRQFGIICAIDGVAERSLPAGRVGCIASVRDVEMLPDGRANIVVEGAERFALERIADDAAPYLVADVTLIGDDSTDAPVAVAVVADEVTSNFKRVVTAVHTLNDDTSPPPALPDDPAQLAFSIAGMVDFELAQRQALLESRSPMSRLTLVNGVLRTVLPDLELKAAMHQARR
jgi:Lon protease-like protein